VTIEVRLFANLARYLPPDARAGVARLDVPDGATVDEVRRRLAIPDELPGLFLVNGREVGGDRPLRPGDVLTIIPPLAGGLGAGGRPGRVPARVARRPFA
jgi:molybdopterin converting factor small subunit